MALDYDNVFQLFIDSLKDLFSWPVFGALASAAALIYSANLEVNFITLAVPSLLAWITFIHYGLRTSSEIGKDNFSKSPHIGNMFVVLIPLAVSIPSIYIQNDITNFGINREPDYCIFSIDFLCVQSSSHLFGRF